MTALPVPEDTGVSKAENLLSWNLHSSEARASDFPHTPPRPQSCVALDTVCINQDLNLALPATDHKAHFLWDTTAHEKQDKYTVCVEWLSVSTV